MSYIIFIGVLVILTIEVLKFEPNLQRTISIYLLLFLIVIVMIYSITILQKILPYFVFFSILYFTSIFYLALHKWIVKYCSGNINCSLYMVATGLSVFISVLISVGIAVYLNEYMGNHPQLYQSQDLIGITIALSLLGLLIGLFFFGTLITEVLFISELINSHISKKSVALFGSGLLVSGVIILLFVNIDIIQSTGIAFSSIGGIAVISLLFDHLKQKYSLKF